MAINTVDYSRIRAQYAANARELTTMGHPRAAEYGRLSHADDQMLAAHLSSARVAGLVQARLRVLGARR